MYLNKETKMKTKIRSCWMKSLNKLIRLYNRINQLDGTVSGNATSIKRQVVMEKAIRTIRNEHNYKINDVNNLGHKHLLALFRGWEEKMWQGKMAATTIRNHKNIVEILCTWIGKRHLILPPEHWMIDVARYKRELVKNKDVDKGWTPNLQQRIEMVDAVEKVDKHVYIQLRLMLAFGLRMQEAVLLRPTISAETNALRVERGSKGGRPRMVPFSEDTEFREIQMKTLADAKAMVFPNSQSLVPPKYTLKSWVARFYYICRKCGISKELKIIPHGLRHDYANDMFKRVTGESSSVRGGNMLAIDPIENRQARLKVAQDLGHNRPGISSTYIGFEKCHKKRADQFDGK